MSITTKSGDGGETSLGDGTRVSKGELRVEAYGAIDELNAAIGLARAMCPDAEIGDPVRAIQRDLFAVGAALSTRAQAREPVPEIGDAMVAQLDGWCDAMEATPGLLRDWSIAGDFAASAHFDVARTVCRRAERTVVRYVSSGGVVQPNVLAYLNRLSDAMWLCARLLELRAGVDARLRDDAHPGAPWSRAW